MSNGLNSRKLKITRAGSKGDTMTFTQHFDRFVYVGDYIEFHLDREFTVRATIEHDADTSPADYDCYGDEDAAAWRNEDWFYCGVVLSIWVGDDCFREHATSLWAVEANIGTDNAYLREVANELLPEAMSALEELREALCGVE